MRKTYVLILTASLAALVVWFGPGLPVMAQTNEAISARIETSISDDMAQDAVLAEQILGDMAEKYRYLDDVSITMGATPAGEQAVSYYTRGHIVISQDHTVSTEAILGHEIWHIIDWREDGSLDWGEHVPPSDAQSYMK